MPLFLIERSFAEALSLSASDEDNIVQVNDQHQIQWLYSFLSADRRKTYCLYQAASSEAIRRAADRLSIPSDVIVEVTPVGPHAELAKPPPAVLPDP